MMTGSGVQPTVTWGIVAAQLGFQRAATDLKTAAVNPEGRHRRRWNGCSTCSTSTRSRTRDVTDRYKAFGTGQGSIFWTGPWTLNGYVQQKLPFAHLPVPEDRRRAADLFRAGRARALHADRHRPPRGDHGRGQVAVRQQLPVDHGRPRRLARGSRSWSGPTTRPPACPGRCAAPSSTACPSPPLGEIPVLAGPDFTIYSGGNFLAKTLEGVWAGQSQARGGDGDRSQAQWQKGLDAG